VPELRLFCCQSGGWTVPGKYAKILSNLCEFRAGRSHKRLVSTWEISATDRAGKQHVTAEQDRIGTINQADMPLSVSRGIDHLKAVAPPLNDIAFLQRPINVIHDIVDAFGVESRQV
jgi:hypothetical protein